MKWPLLVLFAVLPLQWFVLAGPLRLHLAAMLLFLGVVVATHRARAFVPVLRLTLAFVVANVALCVVWLGASAYHGAGFRGPVQQLVYLGVFVAVGTVVLRGLAVEGVRWAETLRWTALVVEVTLLVALWFSMATNGVDAVAVFGRTIAAADPEILQKELFRSAFTGFGFNEDVVRGNIRHEVFGAVLVAMTLSAACQRLQPFRSAAARRLYQLSMVLGVVLIVVSMSRSLMIAAAMWPLLVVVREALAARISPRLVGGALAGVAATVVLGMTGALNVLWVRFTEDTGSYEARDRLLDQALANLGSSSLTGGVETASASSHNFVIDTWLRSGLFGAAAACVIVLLLLGLLLSLACSLHREPEWMVPVAAMLMLPIVRIFTAGGGLIPPVSWVGMGIAAGFLAYHRAGQRAVDPGVGTRLAGQPR